MISIPQNRYQDRVNLGGYLTPLIALKGPEIRAETRDELASRINFLAVSCEYASVFLAHHLRTRSGMKL